MASITSRPRVDGTMSRMVRWRDPETRRQHELTFRSEDEASELMRALNASKQSLAGAFRIIRRQKSVASTVGEVVQEHIDLLVRPSAGSIRTYSAQVDGISIIGVRVGRVKTDERIRLILVSDVFAGQVAAGAH